MGTGLHTRTDNRYHGRNLYRLESSYLVRQPEVNETAGEVTCIISRPEGAESGGIEVEVRDELRVTNDRGGEARVVTVEEGTEGTVQDTKEIVLIHFEKDTEDPMVQRRGCNRQKGFLSCEKSIEIRFGL